MTMLAPFSTVIASPAGVVLENRTLIIQVLLILGIVGITGWLFIKRGARQLAIRRLLILAFAGFAVLAVIFPASVTAIARFVGSAAAQIFFFTPRWSCCWAFSHSKRPVPKPRRNARQSWRAR